MGMGSNIHFDSTAIQKAGLQIALTETIAQETNSETLQSYADNATFNPLALQRRFEPLEKRTIQKKGEEKEVDKPEEPVIQEVKNVENAAEKFEEKNPELKAKSLLNLRSRLSTQDSPETILKKVLEAYPDHSLADEALEFLISTYTDELSDKLKEAKNQLNQIYGREVRAGKNIAVQSREFASQGLGTPTALRDLYNVITQNPKEPATLFAELTTSFSFDKLKTVIAFILHSLGSDLKSKGPSIPKGELANLLHEAKSMQAILGVYRFFKSRIRLIFSSFEREGLPTPSKVTFEILAKMFVKLLLERFPSADKVYQLGLQLGLQDDLTGEMIIFSQMRDAVRQVDPRLFRDLPHRDEILNLFLAVLKEIDDKLDQEDQEEEEIEQTQKEESNKEVEKGA